MQESLFHQGLELMLFGMGTVFVFLIVLVGATRLLSTVVDALGLAEVEVELPLVATTTTDVDTRLPAIITAALAMHRKRRR